MVTVFTNAPAAYDYGYTVEIEPAMVYMIGGREVSGRLVEIPDDAANYQCDRYRSGMYVVEVLAR